MFCNKRHFCNHKIVWVQTHLSTLTVCHKRTRITSSAMDTIKGKLIVKNNSLSNIVFVYELTNTSNKTLHVCKHNTPLEEEIYGNTTLKAVDTATKKAISCKAIMAKRSIDKDDYITLKPGETISNEFHGNFFAFQSKHTYEVSVKNKWSQTLDLNLASKASEILTVETPTITFTIDMKLEQLFEQEKPKYAHDVSVITEK